MSHACTGVMATDPNDKTCTCLACRIDKALDIAKNYGGIDGDHHKRWTIDQMVRALTGCPMVTRRAPTYTGRVQSYEEQGMSDEYIEFVKDAKAGEDGPETYDWNEGIAP
jgi:hypothetical protein